MLDEFHASDFLVQMRPRHGVQFEFLDDFDGNTLAREHVTSQFHNREMSWAGKQDQRCVLLMNDVDEWMNDVDELMNVVDEWINVFLCMIVV